MMFFEGKKVWITTHGMPSILGTIEASNAQGMLFTDCGRKVFTFAPWHQVDSIEYHIEDDNDKKEAASHSAPVTPGFCGL